jgi:hypothetical protein
VPSPFDPPSHPFAIRALPLSISFVSLLAFFLPVWRLLVFVPVGLVFGVSPSQLDVLFNVFNQSKCGGWCPDRATVERELAIDCNYTHGFRVTLLCKGDDLTFLEISGVRVTGRIATEVALLSNLEQLDMRVNLLTGTMPTQIAQLTRLTHLNFG